MNSKKILMIIMAVVIVAVIGVLIWKGVGNRTGFDSTVPTTKNPMTDTTADGTGGQTTGGSIGKMTDAIFIEIAAQSAYYAQKNPAGWTAYLETLFKKYDITEENITAYGESFSNDPQHAAEIAQKYAQRLSELLNPGK